MIKIGIIGFGNVAWNVHLPVLMSRSDVLISWICEINLEKKNVIKKKKINFFNNLDEAIKSENVDIILITTPYSERRKIFEKIKDSCQGIFFEKPHALTLEENNYFSKYFKSYSLTVGYTRRRLGIVASMKKIIKQGIFGNLKSINISFGDIHYNFDNFRSDIKKSGGGIFFEAGTHWIDCALYTSGAQEILNFKSEKKFEDYLDIESSGEFEIIDKTKNQFECRFKISTLENTNNKIEYNFEKCTIDLCLFDDNSNLIIKNKKGNDFLIQENEFLNSPNNSLDVNWVYWNDFLNSFKLKKESDISYDSFFLTSKITELFYEN